MNSTVANHIDSRPEKCGGRPCITGTRIRVQDIYVWHELQGQTPEEIVTNFPQLSLADVHAAMAYYHDNRQQIQADIRVEKGMADSLKTSHPSKFMRRLMGKDANSDSVSA
jgi:uncharacterized protein (DUF433 family)